MDFHSHTFTLEQRVIATLGFFEIFEFCLTLEELHYFLLGNQESLKKLQTALGNMPQISFKNDYYFLKGQEFLVKLTEERRENARVFWKKVYFHIFFLKMVPFIKFVAVCNNLAFNNVTQKSDIDLFIVAKSNRIFFTRLLSTVLLHILGARRHGKKISQRFCLSFYITEDSANFKPLLYKPYDIYFAFWLVSLKPILEPNYFTHLISQNKWLGNYFGSVEKRLYLKTLQKEHNSLVRSILEFLLKGKLGDYLEMKLGKYFLMRHKKKSLSFKENASVIVSKSILKYHNEDQRLEIRRKFEERLKDFNLFV